MYLDPTDVGYSLSIRSLCRLIQKVFNNCIFVVQPETQHGQEFQSEHFFTIYGMAAQYIGSADTLIWIEPDCLM